MLHKTAISGVADSAVSSLDSRYDCHLPQAGLDSEARHLINLKNRSAASVFDLTQPKASSLPSRLPKKALAAFRNRSSHCPVPAQRQRDDQPQSSAIQRHSCCSIANAWVQQNGANQRATVFSLRSRNQPARIRAIPLSRPQSLTQLHQPKWHYLKSKASCFLVKPPV